MTHHEWEQVQEATRTVRSHWTGTPRVGLVLGTGLGALAGEIESAATIPYPEIPSFPIRRSRATRVNWFAEAWLDSR